MKTTITTLYLFLTIPFLSCTVNKWNVDRYISKFERNRKDFEELVTILKTQNIKIGYPINENDFSESIQHLLGKLDISAVNLSHTHCVGIPDYEFTTSWTSKAKVYFSKNTCNKEQTIKGNHAKLSEMIEVWGLGDDWIMWIDYDFI